MIFSVYSRVIVGLINWKMQLVNQNFPQFLPLCSTDASRTEHVAQHVIKQVSNTYILDRFRKIVIAGEKLSRAQNLFGSQLFWAPTCMSYYTTANCNLQIATSFTTDTASAIDTNMDSVFDTANCNLQSANCKVQSANCNFFY